MKRLDSIVLKTFLYGLPAVIALAVFALPYNPETINRAPAYLRLLYNFSGFVFGAWMVFAVYLSVRLMVSSAFRDKVLAKLTFIRERDEREVILTGKAARTTLLTSLAILIFLFCLSCFQVSIYRVSPEKAIDGKADKKELIAFMDKVYPEWDRERVYPSDLKKLFVWYNILIEHNLIDDKPAEEAKDETSEKPADE